MRHQLAAKSNLVSGRLGNFAKIMTVMLFALAAAYSVKPAGAAPMPDIESATAQARKHLRVMAFRIKMFHHEARSSLTSSLELPEFADYFSLPESKKNTYDDLGQIQLTPDQHLRRGMLEEWTMGLHNRFTIGETCLIDRYGQEHLRVVHGEIEPPLHFSPDEWDSPFFAATLALNKGEVHISKPYMSADALEWVSAYSSPVTLTDGSKPGFFHFEIPLEIYQQILSTKDYEFGGVREATVDFAEEGRHFIINRDGLLIADSRGTVDFKIKDERNPEKNTDLPEYLPPERKKDYAKPASSITQEAAFEQAIQKMLKEKQGELSLNLFGRDYVIVFQPVPDRDWIMAHFDPVGGPAFWDAK